MSSHTLAHLNAKIYRKIKFYRDPFLFDENFPRKVKNKSSEQIMNLKQCAYFLVEKNFKIHHETTSMENEKIQNF